MRIAELAATVFGHTSSYRPFGLRASGPFWASGVLIEAIWDGRTGGPRGTWDGTGDRDLTIAMGRAKIQCCMDQATANTELVTRQLDVPHHLRALSSLDRVDYADSFLMRVPDSRRWPAERWARLVLTDAPPELRARLVTGWLALGLKLSRHPGSILGWTVRIGTPDHVLLGRGRASGCQPS
jgi:hypothetical protein